MINILKLKRQHGNFPPIEGNEDKILLVDFVHGGMSLFYTLTYEWHNGDTTYLEPNGNQGREKYGSGIMKNKGWALIDKIEWS
jgi:hypothetical protein